MASVYTHRNFCTETLLHTEKLLHTASFYTQRSFYTQHAFTEKGFTHCIITTGIAAPKADLDAKAKKKTILEHFLKGFVKGK